MERVGIIGAGMAGLACAQTLSRAGFEVQLFDKGRGPGGRMSTRRMSTPLGEVSIDHGAQYFTARAPAFIQQVRQWQQIGVVAPWYAAGDEAWVGVPKMNSVIASLCDGQDVNFNALVTGLERRSDGWHFRFSNGCEGPFSKAVLAIPAEQAAPILALQDLQMAKLALQSRARPCWTGLFAFEARVPIAVDVLRYCGNIGWAARNSAKPDRHGPESWVVQAQPGWSEEHLEDDPATIQNQLLSMLAEATSSALPATIASSAHRWRFAMSIGTGETALWNEELQLGACGDWLLGPRVECAWLSGASLGETVTRAGRFLVNENVATV